MLADPTRSNGPRQQPELFVQLPRERGRDAMRKEKRWRYYCDHCNKAGGHAGAMKKHETYCTMNPERLCRMCAVDPNNYDGPRPMAELIAICGIGYGTVNSNSMASTVGVDIFKLPDELIEATQDCPACILAALRQSNVTFDFDYAKARDAFWERINRERDETERNEEYASIVGM